MYNPSTDVSKLDDAQAFALELLKRAELASRQAMHTTDMGGRSAITAALIAAMTAHYLSR